MLCSLFKSECTERDKTKQRLVKNYHKIDSDNMKVMSERPNVPFL